MEWLERVWLPRAVRMGLRYIAHVVQQDTSSDILSLSFPQAVVGTVELQIFHRMEEAEA